MTQRAVSWKAAEAAADAMKFETGRSLMKIGLALLVMLAVAGVLATIYMRPNRRGPDPTFSGSGPALLLLWWRANAGSIWARWALASVVFLAALATGTTFAQRLSVFPAQSPLYPLICTLSLLGVLGILTCSKSVDYFLAGRRLGIRP
jgi:hypothetical protein